MNSFDHFCEFAWGHLDDVFELDESQGIPRHSPYLEFIIGCATVALSGHSPSQQKEMLGFTLNEIVNNDNPDLDFGYLFYDKYSRRNILSASFARDGSVRSILPCGCSPESPQGTCSCTRKTSCI